MRVFAKLWFLFFCMSPFVAGIGYAASSPLNSSASLANARESHIATLLPSGKQLVASGTHVDALPGATHSTLATAPGQPPAPVASGGVLQATVTFAPPSDDGGASIDSFTVTATPGGATYSCVVSCSSAAFDLHPGTYTFVVAAHNAAGFGPNSAPSNSVAVTQATTTISIGAVTTVAPGADATFTATINDASNPGGNIYFCADATDIFTCAGGTSLCTVAANTSPASCATNTLSAGVHAVRAYFPGDTDNSASSSRITEYVGVAPAITSADTTTFEVGVPGNFTVTTGGAPVPTLDASDIVSPDGVMFTDNGNGTATIAGTPASGSAGSYQLFVHAQNAIAPDAMQTFTLFIAKKSTTLTLTVTPDPAMPGAPVQIAASVAGDPPSGTVTFCDAAVGSASCSGGSNLCAAAALTPGATSSSATCSATFATAGTHMLTAFYSGDGDFAAVATATALRLAVGAPAATVPAPLGRLARLLIIALLGIIGAAALARARACA